MIARFLLIVFVTVFTGVASYAVAAEPTGANQSGVPGKQSVKRQCVGQGARCGGDATGYCCPGLTCSGGMRNMYCK
jgi:hypothetical protein